MMLTGSLLLITATTRTQFDVGIDFPVWKGLSVTALYSFTHEHVVVTNIQQEDKILTFGLGYNLKIKTTMKMSDQLSLYCLHYAQA